MMIIESKINIGQLVYLKTDKEQHERMVTGLLLRPTGITYELVLGDRSSWHYEIEISEEKDIVVITT